MSRSDGADTALRFWGLDDAAVRLRLLDGALDPQCPGRGVEVGPALIRAGRGCPGDDGDYTMKEYITEHAPNSLSIRVRREVLRHFNCDRVSSVELANFDPEMLRTQNFGEKSIRSLKKWIMEHRPVPVRSVLPVDQKPVLQFRVRRPVYLALIREAERDGRSISEQAARIIEDALVNDRGRRKSAETLQRKAR